MERSGNLIAFKYGLVSVRALGVLKNKSASTLLPNIIFYQKTANEQFFYAFEICTPFSNTGVKFFYALLCA